MPQLKMPKKSPKEIKTLGSEDRLLLVIEASPSGMIMVDSAGKIALINSQLERLFGYDRTELLGQSIEILGPEAVREKHCQYRDSFF